MPLMVPELFTVMYNAVMGKFAVARYTSVYKRQKKKSESLTPRLSDWLRHRAKILMQLHCDGVVVIAQLI